MTPRLGVNVDHVATLRNARHTPYPDPIEAARLAIGAGAYGITAHLREDRRHILDEDVVRLRALDGVPKFNLEMALTPEIVAIACRVRPDYVCLVPEKRRELTTEGGLSLTEIQKGRALIERLKASGIRISLFLDASLPAIKQMTEIVHPDAVEMHTGTYADDWEKKAPSDVLSAYVDQFCRCGQWMIERGIECHAGHGLHLRNITPLLELRMISEYNIGHAIVAESIFGGWCATIESYSALFSKYPIRQDACVPSSPVGVS